MSSFPALDIKTVHEPDASSERVDPSVGTPLRNCARRERDDRGERRGAHFAPYLGWRPPAACAATATVIN